ncbi:MAG TPA: SEC-C domain-containing protein [Conexibacter sp.]|nr:SEC-C domain-containing protein [Conexibacter sp.]
MSNPRNFAPVGFGWELLKGNALNRLRVAGAEELLGAGGALIDATGRQALSGAPLLLAAQATRAHHTFETVIAAARMGRGVQAAMLNRALLEDVLSIHWTAEHPKQAPDRAEEHDRLIALAEHDLDDKFGRVDRPLTDEEREELQKLIKLYGGARKAFRAPWHRTDTGDCFELVKKRWRDEPDAGPALDYIYEGIQRRNNLFLHSSPTAFRQTIAIDASGKRQLNRVGPDTRWSQSLRQGAGGYYLVCRVLPEEFDLDRQPIVDAFVTTTAYCRSPDEFPDLAALPDDAPCPCGSGRSAGDCHRS